MKITKCDGKKIYFDSGYEISYTCIPAVEDTYMELLTNNDIDYKNNVLIGTDKREGIFTINKGKNKDFIKIYSPKRAFVSLYLNNEFLCGKYVGGKE